MSQEKDIPPAVDSDSTAETKKPTAKKRKWLRRLIWIFIILGILIYLISGIGARKTGEYFINQSLEEQGMTGSLELLGSLDSGFQLKNLRYTGEKGIQLLEIDEMAVDYELAKLKDFKVDLLKLDRLKAVIDIDKFPPSETKTEEDEDPSDWKQTLGLLKPMLTNPEIDISDLDITLLQSAKKMAHFQLGGIQHSATSNEINLIDWKVTDANGLSTPVQSSTLIWNDKNISFDRLELIPQLALGKINFDWKDKLQGNASIDFHDASIQFDVNQDETEAISVKLTEGELRASDVFKTLNSFGIETDSYDPNISLNELSVNLPFTEKLATGDFNIDWQNDLLAHASIGYYNANIHLEVNQDETQSISVKLTEGEIRAADVFKTLKSLDIETDNYDSEISLNELSVNLPFTEKLTAGDFDIDWQNDLLAHASIAYHDANIKLDLNQDETKSIDLKLTKGELRTADIFPTLNGLDISTDEYDAEAVLNKLTLNIPANNLDLAPPLWKVDSEIGIKSARYENYTTKNTTLTLNQESKNYQLLIKATALDAPLDLNVKGKWNEPAEENFWEYTDVDLDLKTQLNESIIALIPEADQIPSDIDITRSKISLKANTNIIALDPNKSHAEIEISNINISEHKLPTIGIIADYNNKIANVNVRSKQTTELLANVNIDTSTFNYTSAVITRTSSKASPWINALAKIYEAPISINEEIDIHWDGSGNITSNTHIGNITTTDLIITQIEENGLQGDPITINLLGEYDFPNNVSLKRLSVKQQELFATASFLWDGETIKLHDSQIKRFDEPITNITGSIPFNLEIDDATKFFNQTKDWQIVIDTDELKLQRISELIALPNSTEITGSLQTTIKVSGTPKNPVINGNFNINSVNDIFDLGLDDLSLNTTFKTQDQLFSIEGKILEANGELVALDLKFPFKPNAWLQDDNLVETLLTNSQIQGKADIKRFPLNRLNNLVPELEKIEGLVDVKAEFTGTIENPKYKINFLADLPVVSLKDMGVDDITEIKFTGNLDEDMKLETLLTAKINGGKFNVTADADLTDPLDPIFDVKLITNHALVYRDESVAVRSNVDLNLKGTLANATLSGEVGILESLFYQDIDLIPIGVPSTTVETVSLPSLNTQSTTTLPIPVPFDKWKLDLTLKTIDPILIRGNIGNGRVEGSVKVAGLLSKPSLDGSFYTKDVSAKLPFSKLKINKGKVIFKPNSGFIPQLQVLGKSQIGEYNVTINAYGSADNPQLTLSSFPALPETEIMTLLATGATNSGLNNSDVATFKTLQLLLFELKQRNERPGGNKLFATLLDGIDKFNLKVGEVNDLTGEKFASATFKLHRRWFLSAQIDDNEPPQTRGLIIFALRFN